MEGKEVWKDIKGYERLYQVSNLGRVKRLSYKTKSGSYKPDLIKKKTIGSSGYYVVSLQLNGLSVTKRVHRLVATAFKPKINGKNHINHIDHNKLNNCHLNLEWCTPSENTEKARDFGAMDHTYVSVYKVHPKTGSVIKKYNCIAEAGREHGVTGSNITDACKGRIKSCAGFIWSYNTLDIDKKIQLLDGVKSHGKSKPVICYDLSGVEVGRYASVNEAARAIGTSYKVGIRSSCEDPTKVYNNLHWKYK